ncbi:methyltransferase MT-A70, putative (ISS) [Planoprotostelium fungivorum]|uniref:Methyltransferase MT-A70, putative (ISS) n=1 Tax=Planoprotostelium fungivorum TaxID=1890364 RepID=A0A2P6NKM3_9EUKA|nr:methyltransferase MT-A70, putative (ISS) [Planoprotostelium fungivorum]
MVGVTKKRKTTETPKPQTQPQQPRRQLDLSAFFTGVKPLPPPSLLDDNLPYNYIKVPTPLPASWATVIQPFSLSSVTGSIYMELEKLPSANDFEGSFDAILMDIPWEEPGVVPAVGKWRIEKDLLCDGMLFIWAEKEHTLQTIKLASLWGFSYVENLIWVKKETNNKMILRDYEYVKKNKHTLLMFKRGDKIELRHQRSPDVIIDFQRIERGGREQKPASIYEVIETMLPLAAYDEKTQRGRFLELWSQKGQQRIGWTSVYFEPESMQSEEQSDDINLKVFDTTTHPDHQLGL